MFGGELSHPQNSMRLKYLLNDQGVHGKGDAYKRMNALVYEANADANRKSDGSLQSNTTTTIMFWR